MKVTESSRKKNLWYWVIFAVGMCVVFALGLLAASITERRAEVASIYNNKKVAIEGIEPRAEKWALNYPREYDTWQRTQNMDFKSKHLGNQFEDVLAQRPEMVILWAGYAFAKDYNAPRGHMYTITDTRQTLRTGTPEKPEDGPQPATCWTCKSPDVPRMMQEIGVENFYKSKWGEMGPQIVNPLGCADCHDPATMNLTITRPALREAFARQGIDIAKASPQEMRSLVCAQCHVEYYFKGDGKYLTFPWDKGFSMEQMEQYYDEVQYTDWVHALSKAPMLKAQHPDYELFKMGPHGQRGLACADCHMPYKAEGAFKYSDHQVMSPLANISGTCQTCHRDSEENLRNYVYGYQDKILEVRNRVEKELAKAHLLAQKAWEHNATEQEMQDSLKLIRQAQWRWDFGVASHGASFHAPVETQRILSQSLDKALQAQLALQKVLYAHNVLDPELPDVSSKEKAQAYIGLDMEKERAAKQQWLEKTIPAWIEEAQKNNRI